MEAIPYKHGQVTGQYHLLPGLIYDLVFVQSCSRNYILRASTVQRLNTEDWATSANLSTYLLHSIKLKLQN